jgi:hypothetical protein
MRKVHRGFGGATWRKKEKHGRPRRRWEDNTKMKLQVIGWGTLTGLVWFRIETNGGLFCILL